MTVDALTRTPTAASVLPGALGRPDVAAADFVFAHDGVALLGRHEAPLDLAPVAQAGAAGTAATVRDALAGRHGDIIAGLIPFDPAERPHLSLIARPRTVAVPTIAAHPAAAAAMHVENSPSALGTKRGEVDHDVLEAEPGDGAGRARDVRRAAPHRLGPEAQSEPGAFAADDRVGRDDPAYRARVARAVRRIGNGELDKVVLARSVDLTPSVDPTDLWFALLHRNPHAYVFSARYPGGTMVGASPELVAQVDADGFRTRPLAGSLPRGGSATEDHARAQELLTSAKDLHEHRFVVDHITDRLAPISLDLRVPTGPTVFATDSMLHLGTDLSGRLRGTSSLEAALTIHPTPAVCGVPQARALSAIRDLEPESRGMYAGLAGWTDGRGHGTWVLVLRSALVGGDSVRVHAGAGVVDGSTPEAEQAETTAKFATVASAWADAVATAGVNR